MSDLLKVNIRNIGIIVSETQSHMKKPVSVISSIGTDFLTVSQNFINITGTDAVKEDIFVKMRQYDQFYHPSITQLGTGTVKNRCIDISEPVIQVFRKSKRHVPGFF